MIFAFLDHRTVLFGEAGQLSLVGEGLHEPQRRRRVLTSAQSFHVSLEPRVDILGRLAIHIAEQFLHLVHLGGGRRVGRGALKLRPQRLKTFTGGVGEERIRVRTPAQRCVQLADHIRAMLRLHEEQKRARAFIARLVIRRVRGAFAFGEEGAIGMTELEPDTFRDALHPAERPLFVFVRLGHMSQFVDQDGAEVGRILGHPVQSRSIRREAIRIDEYLRVLRVDRTQVSPARAAVAQMLEDDVELLRHCRRVLHQQREDFGILFIPNPARFFRVALHLRGLAPIHLANELALVTDEAGVPRRRSTSAQQPNSSRETNEWNPSAKCTEKQAHVRFEFNDAAMDTNAA